jgi:hypothetical protein
METSFDLNRRRRSLFTANARAYDDGRPGYPAELYSILTEV